MLLMVLLLLIEKKEAPSRREVFPVGVVVHGDPPLPVSGVIQRCDPTPEKVCPGFDREAAA